VCRSLLYVGVVLILLPVGGAVVFVRPCCSFVVPPSFRSSSPCSFVIGVPLRSFGGVVGSPPFVRTVVVVTTGTHDPPCGQELAAVVVGGYQHVRDQVTWP
jgi:hypothetical protein